MSKNKDEAAFARPVGSNAFDSNNASHGLTKREYFAAMALQGLLGNGSSDTIEFRPYAVAAVKCADALLDALEDYS